MDIFTNNSNSVQNTNIMKYEQENNVPEQNSSVQETCCKIGNATDSTTSAVEIIDSTDVNSSPDKKSNKSFIVKEPFQLRSLRVLEYIGYIILLLFAVAIRVLHWPLFSVVCVVIIAFAWHGLIVWIYKRSTEHLMNNDE